MRMPVHGGSAKARAAGAGAAVVALVLLASLAGRHPAWSTGVGRRPLVSGASNVAVTFLLLAFVGAFVAAYVRLLRQRRAGFTRADAAVAIALLVALLVATLLAVYGPRFGADHGRSGPARPLPGGGPPGGAGRGGGGLHTPDAKWLFVLPLLGLVLAAWFFVVARRRTPPAAPIAEPVADAVVTVLDETLDDLENERDPRRAVIAAYARMEDVLAQHGLGRRPAETPYEYLARVLTELRASERSAQRLAELFEWAKFSTHEVSERMRLDAIGCLTRLRTEVAR